ncbi:UNVERIFIED_CONTAM: hypothetical protein FKN15_017597 [Acipenser sinensis]
MRCFKCGAQGHQRKQCPRNRDRAEAERDKGALGGEEARGDWGEREDEQHLEPAKPESAEPAEPKAAVPEAVSTPQYKRHSQAQTASRQETGQSQEFEIVAKKKKKKKNIQSEEGEPKLDPGLVFVGSGEKTQSPGVKVAESGGDPQPMPDEELTSSPEAVPPCPEEEGTSTELPQSDYETGSKTGGGTEAEAVESGESVEKDGGEKTQSPGVKVAESGGDPQPMPDEELTSSPEAVPPCPEEEGTSTELPQSDYETGSKTGGGTEAEAVAVESGEAAEKDGADGEEDEGISTHYPPTRWCQRGMSMDRHTLQAVPEEQERHRDGVERRREERDAQRDADRTAHMTAMADKMAAMCLAIQNLVVAQAQGPIPPLLLLLHSPRQALPCAQPALPPRERSRSSPRSSKRLKPSKQSQDIAELKAQIAQVLELYAKLAQSPPIPQVPAIMEQTLTSLVPTLEKSEDPYCETGLQDAFPELTKESLSEPVLKTGTSAAMSDIHALMGRACQFLQVPWTEPQQSHPSAFGDQFSVPQQQPFPDFLEQDAPRLGLEDFLAVDSTIVVLILPAQLVDSLRSDMPKQPVSSTLLKNTGFQAQASGRSLASLVVARRQRWLSQARVPDLDKDRRDCIA